MLSDAAFTPNPNRAIWLEGEIDRAMEERLRPQIIELTSSSQEPVTLYIDSPGGNPAAASRILCLLRSTNHGDASACRIITVALSHARSAAADLLSAGDFVIAQPSSKLLYHGTRIPFSGELTAVHARRLGYGLKVMSSTFCSSLAYDSAHRFMFLLCALRSRFEAHRVNANNSALAELDCLQEILCQIAPPAAQNVLRNAAAVCQRYRGLITNFESELAKLASLGETAGVEKAMLTASIGFEYEESETDQENWNFLTVGLGRIVEHCLFLNEYFQGMSGARLRTLCERWALVSGEEAASEQSEPFRTYFLPFWSFLIAVCHALQHGENELTTVDALYLGLVDTILEDVGA